MTAFVETLQRTVRGPAAAVARRARGRPKVRRLLRLLADKRRILVTTHQHPDPDAIASSLALCRLLSIKLPGAKVTLSVKGQLWGGVNDAFFKASNLSLAAWSDARLRHTDAVVLLDVQPAFASSPLPPGVTPVAVIDHHRARTVRCPFCDVRTDVGASTSIVFSYYVELNEPIPPDLAAVMLYAIESDLAGAAGTPGELDNLALSSLTLVADTRKLYQMRYVDLPQGYFRAYAAGLNGAMVYDNAILAHIGASDSPEKPAVIADFLLRYDQVQWALVTGVFEGKLVASIRTSDPKLSAAEMARRLFKGVGEGGGHRTKAGGFVRLTTDTDGEVDRHRATLRRRYLRALHVKVSRGQRLVP